MAKSLHPFLMFQGGPAQEAMKFYASLFPGSKIEGLELYGPGEQGPEGTVKRAMLTIVGQELRVFDSPVKHEFDFTPAFSFFVECESEEELRRLAGALDSGGKVFMPIGSYGFSKLFAWVGDKYGITWQLNFN